MTTSAPDDLVPHYLRAMQAADVESILELFAPGGIVDSPLYGVLPATEFFPALFADTSDAKLTLKAVMRGETVTGSPVVRFWFHFDWRLPSGAAAPFEVVDVAELDADGKIERLHLVYDTIDVRAEYEADTGRTSHRQPR